MKLQEEKIRTYGKLTAYLHEPSAEMPNVTSYPAILVLPGGGFRMCSDREAEPIAMAFFAAGYQAFVLKYTTVTDKKDAAIQDPMNDVCTAVKTIREKAGEYRIREKSLAMIGFSGGAHLAAAVATHGPERPDALLLGYPGILHSDLRALECPDIIEKVDRNTPPTFLFVTRDDPVTPPKHALAFASALEEAGVDFELHVFRTGSHGISLATSFTCAGDRKLENPQVARWVTFAQEWLKAKFGDFTIYGVNDGRYGRFSIDSDLGTVLGNEEAKKAAISVMPELEKAENVPQVHSISIRSIAGFMPNLVNPEKLEELDRVLLAVR